MRNHTTALLSGRQPQEDSAVAMQYMYGRLCAGHEKLPASVLPLDYRDIASEGHVLRNAIHY